MKAWRYVSLVTLFLGAFVVALRAEDISGTIATTRTILNDSQLVGNVTCTMTDAAATTERGRSPRCRLR